jgi:hypothetical protein
MSVNPRLRRRFAVPLIAAGALLAFPSVGLAIQSENGYKNCGTKIAAMQARALGGLAHTPPGGSTANYFLPNWTTITRNGGYSGNWVASADYLNFGSTYAFCQPYG